MTEIKFTCPKCGSSQIEEIMVEMTVATEIDKVKKRDDGSIDYVAGEQTNEDGHVDRFQCGECGHTIVDGDSSYADEGLDICALAKAVDAINNPPKGDPVSHGELVQRIADQFATLSGADLEREWNRIMDDEVVYAGDSLYWVEG